MMQTNQSTTIEDMTHRFPWRPSKAGVGKYCHAERGRREASQPCVTEIFRRGAAHALPKGCKQRGRARRNDQ
jgi:hypothetical protein